MPVYSGLPFDTSAAGSGESIAIDESGNVVVWGDTGSLGATPSGLSGSTNVTAGQGYVLAVKSDGTVEAWGAPYFDEGQTSVPAGLSGVVMVSASTRHVLALKDDGTVIGWGRNVDGQISIPAGLSGVAQVAAGASFSAALKSDGTVVAWGDSGSNRTNVPSGLSGVVKIAAGYDHTLALKDDGTVSAWGAELYGGETTVPAGLSGVVSITAGEGHSAALKDDGTVVSWGALASPSLSNVYEIYGGRAYMLAVYADGSMTGWGADGNGQSSPDPSLRITLSGESPVDNPIVAQVGISANLSGSVAEAGQIHASISLSSQAYGYKADSHGAVSAAIGVSGAASGNVDWTQRLDPLEIQEIYTLTITGAADSLDDFVVKISSWQATNQAGTRSSYVQAVIPAASDALSAIEARQNGDLVISKGYSFLDGSTKTTEILRSNFDTFRYDRGARRFTVTVSGFLSGKVEQNSTRTLTGIRSLNVTNGKRRTRCNIDMFLQPGMTVEALNESFKADYINYYVAENDKFCEVSER